MKKSKPLMLAGLSVAVFGTLSVTSVVATSEVRESTPLRSKPTLIESKAAESIKTPEGTVELSDLRQEKQKAEAAKQQEQRLPGAAKKDEARAKPMLIEGQTRRPSAAARATAKVDPLPSVDVGGEMTPEKEELLEQHTARARTLAMEAGVPPEHLGKVTDETTRHCAGEGAAGHIEHIPETGAAVTCVADIKHVKN